MTKVFITDISCLNSDISRYKDYISEYRYEKAKRQKKIQNQLLGIGAELLLGKYLGRRPNYTVDEYGKPAGEEVEFNFSHSGSIAVCAVSHTPVGVDVEKIRDVNMDIAKKKFCSNEYKNIINSQQPREKFFEYWVKKESYVKALGMGLRMPFNETDTDAVADWQMHMYDDIEGYKLCVCTKEPVEFVFLSEF